MPSERVTLEQKLYWHCECGINEPAQPEYDYGDCEPCVYCDMVRRACSQSKNAQPGSKRRRWGVRGGRTLTQDSKSAAPSTCGRSAWTSLALSLMI